MHNMESYENINILRDVINYDKSNGKSVVTQKWLPCYLEYNKDSKNIAASFVNGRAELGLFITQERIGLTENLWNQESSMWKINH